MTPPDRPSAPPGMLVRTPRRQRVPQSTLPVVFRPRVLLPMVAVALLAWGSWAGYQAWRMGRTTFRIVTDGKLVSQPVQLEFFVYGDDASAASPTPKIAQLDSADARVAAGSDLVPGEALVRVRADGFGVSFGYVKLGRENGRIEIAPPAPFEGRVVARKEDPDGAVAPVSGASVLVFGGGSRGVLLAEAETSADGTFRVDDVAKGIDYLVLRVLAPGYSVLEKEWYRSEPLKTLRLRQTRPVRGRVVAPESLGLEGQELRVFHLPGVATRIAADGSFDLDHLPTAPTRCTLLVADLPTEWTHARCVALAGDEDVEIEIVPAGRFVGRVIDRSTRSAVRNVKVYHRNGPAGMEIVSCDEHGRFEIGRVPEGTVRLFADVLVTVRRSREGRIMPVKELRQGWIDLDLENRAMIGDIVLPID